MSKISWFFIFIIGYTCLYAQTDIKAYINDISFYKDLYIIKLSKTNPEIFKNTDSEKNTYLWYLWEEFYESNPIIQLLTIKKIKELNKK